MCAVMQSQSEYCKRVRARTRKIRNNVRALHACAHLYAEIFIVGMFMLAQGVGWRVEPLSEFYSVYFFRTYQRNCNWADLV